MPFTIPKLSPFRAGLRATAVAAAAALAGCATTAPAPVAAPAVTPPSASTPTSWAPGPAAAASAPPGAAPGAALAAAAAARPAPAPQPFAEVVKDAKRDDGFIPVWRKDEKVWLELSPEALNKPFLVSVNIANSIGERGLYASQMGPSWLAEFRKVGSQVQLVARQTSFRAERDAANARAVGEAFSDSLIGAGVVASAPHAESKAVLVDAAFLLGDMAGYSTALEQAFRLPFAPDRANSFFERTHAEAGLTTLKAQLHYAVPRLPAPPLLAPGAPTPPRVAPPQYSGDPRSLFVGVVYNFTRLPDQPMATRAPDGRVGHFIESFTDLSDDLRPNPRTHYITRWRLEKKDPAAALSEPVKPITYWLDRNIPKRYRASIEAGVLEWNKAFERIGYKNAIVVKQQPDDASFDNMDAGHASIRWFVGADVGFAIGPSRVDPRSGEILDADIGMSDVFGRGSRREVREDTLFAAEGHDHAAWPAGTPDALNMRHAAAFCRFAADGARELEFAFDLLAARGDLDPESPEAEAYVQAYIKDVIVHEVGHTLGLRHNFKASTTVTPAQLRDAAYTRKNGLSASVMDYNAANLPLAGEPKGEPHMNTLGPYDYWAIEYAYKPLAPEQEKAELQGIAGRAGGDAALSFADDIDAGGFPGNDGLDPLANRFDLGNDPLAFYKRRLALSKELWARTQQRGAQPGDDALRLQRSVSAGFRQVGRMLPLAAKYVGGMHTTRDLPGSGKANYRPVAPAQQREALQFLTNEVFSSDSFRFKPEFLATMAPDYVEWNRGGPVSVPQIVLQAQSQTLDRLLDPGTARRLLELPNYLPRAQQKGAISLGEVYGTLQNAVWSELKSGREIDPMRRNLQREHLKRLQAVLTRPPATMPADAVSLTRMQALDLQKQLRAAAGNPRLSVESRAHVDDALALLSEALKATMQRS